MKKRILIVNCYFDDARQAVRRRIKPLQAMGLTNDNGHLIHGAIKK